MNKTTARERKLVNKLNACANGQSHGIKPFILGLFINISFVCRCKSTTRKTKYRNRLIWNNVYGDIFKNNKPGNV